MQSFLFTSSSVPHQQITIAADTRRAAGRRGLAYILAMIFMALFSVLAVGFYAQVDLAAQVAANERRAAEAQVAAESGLALVRLQIASITIPPSIKPEHRFQHLHAKLCSEMNGTGNLRGHPIGQGDGRIEIPGRDGAFVELERGGKEFRATIMEEGQNLRVKVVGRHARSPEVLRAVELVFEPQVPDLSLFAQGVTAQGEVNLAGARVVDGAGESLDSAVLSAAALPTPVSVGRGASIKGGVKLVNPTATVKAAAGARVGGFADSRLYEQQVVSGVKAPEFPKVDVAEYRSFATNVLTADSIPATGPASYANVLIPANTNPQFPDGAVLEGVVYVQMPNRITFHGETTVRGVIVYEPAAGYEKGRDNVIEFKGGVTLAGTDGLPDSRAFPDALRELSGASIIAPQTEVRFGGQADVSALTVVAGDVKFTGQGRANVDGNVIAYGDVSLAGQASLRVEVPRQPRVPQAMKFSVVYRALPGTYAEPLP